MKLESNFAFIPSPIIYLINWLFTFVSRLKNLSSWGQQHGSIDSTLAAVNTITYWLLVNSSNSFNCLIKGWEMQVQKSKLCSIIIYGDRWLSQANYRLSWGQIRKNEISFLSRTLSCQKRVMCSGLVINVRCWMLGTNLCGVPEYKMIREFMLTDE